MAAAGLYTFGGAFWEFGDPDWEHTRYFVMFGVAEDHASNPIKRGIGKLKGKGGKFVSINPVRTGYSAVADEWVGIKPGTDGLFVGALIHELMKAQKIDLDYLVRYTNAPWLVIQDKGAADDGLFARDKQGNPLAFDKKKNKLVNAMSPDITPAMVGEFKLPDGRKAVTSLNLLADRFLSKDYAPEAVAEKTGVSAETIRRLAAEMAHAAFEEEVVLDVPWTDWAGRKHDKMIGRPVSMHAMRGISAHSNGFHTCRLIHILQILLGSIDCPEASVTRRRIRSRRRRGSNPPASRKKSRRVSRWADRISAFRSRLMTCFWMTPANPSASTRPSAGMRRSPRTG